jgi:alpha-tubulin suppressor-like RCC1 family protein
VNTESRRHEHRRRRGLRAALLLALAVACSSNDVQVGCSPSLTCAYKDARFAPAPRTDAGSIPCDQPGTRCAARQVSAGGQHTCALGAGGEVFCWGDDSQLQRGPDSGAIGVVSPDSSDEDEAVGFSLVLVNGRQVAAGAAHSCALTESGEVRCWGRNVEGQVDPSAPGAPVLRPHTLALPNIQAIATGAAHSCGLVPAGVACWGDDRYGQVGRLPLTAAGPITIVPNTSGAIAIATGVRHSCALLLDRRVLCWGELVAADGTSAVTPTPAEVPDLSDALTISCGAGHSCALRASGAVACWGANASGQLGDGSTRASASPVQIATPLVAARVVAGGGELDGQLVGHTCALDQDLHVVCWGRNQEGQLGDGTTIDRPTPSIVLAWVNQDDPYLDNTVELALGAFHSCALDDNGPIYCWGDDRDGQLGANTDAMVAVGRAVRVARFGRRP